jgi:hypothetical protein
MFPHYTPARNRCIDKESLSKVAEYWGVPLSRLNYCLDSNEVDIPTAVMDGAGCPQNNP